MIAVLFIGNRVFNHVDAWLGIAICFGVCYPVINIIKLIIKNMKTKIKFMLVALMATVIFHLVSVLLLTMPASLWRITVKR